MILLYMLHSVANNPEEMLHIQISPCFLGVLLSNTEIITVFFTPSISLRCIGLVTILPTYDNALGKKSGYLSGQANGFDKVSIFA